MRRVLVLVHPRIFYEDNYPCSWLPYSLLSVASSVKLSNPEMEILLFDENYENRNVFFNILLSRQSQILCVGFSIMTGGGQINNAIKLARIAKEVDKRISIVFGGPHVNVLPKQTLEHEIVDDVLAGPGQNSMPFYIKYLQGKIQNSQVPGMYSKKNDSNALPMTNKLCADTMVKYNFDLLDLSRYIKRDVIIASRTINYISSLGCPYKCRFCYETNYGRKYTVLNSDSIIEDVKLFTSKFNINGLKIYDADFFVNHNRAYLLMKQFREHNLNWAASVHPNDIARDFNLLSEVSNSGCRRLLMGIESANNRVLNEIIDKRITIKTIYEICRRIAAYGIIGSYTLMVGLPGETEIEQNQTFSFIEKLWKLNPRPEVKVHLYMPYPGTELFNQSIDMGFVAPDRLEDWSSFNYYKAQTPWINEALEKRVVEYTRMYNTYGG